MYCSGNSWLVGGVYHMHLEYGSLLQKATGLHAWQPVNLDAITWDGCATPSPLP